MTELQKAVHETIKSSSTAMQVRDIYSSVKARVPHLCDDSVYPCPYCKQRHPLWQYQTAWAIQGLKQKGLVQSPKRGFWEAVVQSFVEPPHGQASKDEPFHKTIKTKLRQIGEIVGRWAREEYPATPYIYDVVWKEMEGLPRPSHVFEVQDKGNVDMTLSKLQHAKDIWNPKLCLVVTGEKDRKKVAMLKKCLMLGLTFLLVSLVIAGCASQAPSSLTTPPAPTPAPIPTTPPAPILTPTPASPEAVQHYERGKTLAKEGRYDEAIAEFTKAIELAPSFKEAYMNRGVAYENKREFDKAIADFGKRIELDSNYARGYYERGLAYNYEREYDKAILDFDKAIELNPRYAYAYGMRGVAYKNKGDYDKGIADYNKAIDLDPMDVTTYYNRGIAYYEKGERAKAIADFNRVVRLSKDSALTQAAKDALRTLGQ